MLSFKRTAPGTMKMLALAAATLVAAACADDPVGPDMQLSPELVGVQAPGGEKGKKGGGSTDDTSQSDTTQSDTTQADTTQADTTGTTTAGVGDSTYTVWEWLAPLTEDITVSNVCGPRGCNLVAPDYSVQLSIPQKALSHRTTITLTLKAGSVVAIELGPHGTQFNVPVHLYVNSKFTNAKDHPSFEGCGQTSGAAMRSPWLGLYFEGDPNEGTMNVLETFPAFTVSCFVGFDTDHFSGYAIAM